MKSLNNDDFKYFDSKFEQIHSRINDIASDVNAVKVEAEARLTEIETEHKLQKHNNASKKKDIFQSLSVLGAYIGIAIVLIL